MKRSLLLLGILSLAAPALASAQQTNFVLDPTRSLVWWQLDPHFGHLWATTCPKDPSWQAGEGNSGTFNKHVDKNKKIKLTNSSAAAFPLFPRDTVRANCRPSVMGAFSTADVKRFSQVIGTITVLIDSMTNGSTPRDIFAKKYIYSSAKYPTVKFTIDSLTNIRMSGDTVNAVAVGVFELRGVQKVTRVQVQGVQEPTGFRVRGLFAMPAKELQDRYGVSRAILSLGVGSKMWDTLYMGFDLILRPQT